jgi:hypothetical protein
MPELQDFFAGMGTPQIQSSNRPVTLAQVTTSAGNQINKESINEIRNKIDPDHSLTNEELL